MLSRSILTLMIPVPLILFGLGAAFFIEYQKHQVSVAAFGGKELSPVEYVKLRVDTYRQQSEAQAAVAQLDIRDSLPDAAEGWSRVPYEIAHGEQITGSVFEPSMVVKDTEKSIQDNFRSVKPGQKDAVTASYVNGDQVVAIKIRAVPALDTTTLEGQLAKQISAQAAKFSDAENPDPVFTVAGGIEFKQLPQISTHIISQEARPVSYRRFQGKIGAQLSIFIFSNAEDSAILNVIQGIDYATLREFAKISEVVAMLAPSALASGPGSVDATAEQVQAAATDLYREAMKQARSATQTAQGEEAARIIAEASAEIETQLSEPTQKLSFRDRLMGLLGGGTSGDSEDNPQMKTVCTNSQGFKRCVLVEE